MVNRRIKSTVLLALLFFISIVSICDSIFVKADSNDELVIYSQDNNICDYISGEGNYFNSSRAFYKDNEDRVAYCVQTSLSGPSLNGTSGYKVNEASVCVNSNVVEALSNIVCKGYPNSYGTYIVGGNKESPLYKTGLLINNKIYECTNEEANAVTGFAIHRQMLAIQQGGAEGIEGNNNTLYDYSNGSEVGANLVEIEELLTNHSIGYTPQIKIAWASNENGGWKEVNIPEYTVIENNQHIYYEYYVIVTSNNCSIKDVNVGSSQLGVTGARIKTINYDSFNKWRVSILVPATAENICKELKVTTTYSDVISGPILVGHSYLQDMIIQPTKGDISKSISTTTPLGSFQIVKKDETTGNMLKDFTFEVFEDSSCTKSVGKYTTSSDGTVNVENLLKTEYYVKEISGNGKYLLNSELFKVQIDSLNQVELVVSNKQAKGEIHIYKMDSDNKSFIPQGDGVLEGAKYELYANEIIYSPDGSGTILHNKNDVIGETVIDSQGNGCFKNLNFGSYYIKEITPPEGYNLSEDIIEAVIKEEGNKNVIVKVDLFEQVIKQPFQIIKVNSEYTGEAILLEGVGFKAWLKSELSIDENGNYIFEDESAIVLCDDGGKEIFTDSTGYACTIPIPYGEYIVRETTVLEGLEPVEDFQVTINIDSLSPQVWKVLNDKSIKARLRIVKLDGETGETIFQKGFKFKIYDCTNDCYIEQDIFYPSKATINEFETDENGELIIPNEITYGKYIIEEIAVPSDCNYLLSEEKLEINIDSQSVLQEIDGIFYYTVSFANKPVEEDVPVKIIVNKSDFESGVLGESIIKEITPQDNIVKTGDRANLYFIIAILVVIALMIMGISYIIIRRLHV